MGLDTSHNAWHGPYGAFHRWRMKLAEVAGLPPLNMMEGFWTSPREERAMGLGLTIRVAADTIRRMAPGSEVDESLLDAFDSLPIRWDALKPDPLHELLYHSDCDGEIAAEQLEAIAGRLMELVPHMPTDFCVRGKSFREATEQFAKGCKQAADAGEDLLFR